MSKVHLKFDISQHVCHSLSGIYNEIYQFIIILRTTYLMNISRNSTKRPSSSSEDERTLKSVSFRKASHDVELEKRYFEKVSEQSVVESNCCTLPRLSLAEYGVSQVIVVDYCMSCYKIAYISKNILVILTKCSF